MKHFKILGPLAIAAAAMMSFAAGASADQVSTTTGGAASTPTIHAVNEGGHVSIANAIADIHCSSTFVAGVDSHGAGASVSGAIDHLTFTGCTNSWHVTTINPGSFAIEHTGGHNGTIVSNGTRIEATRFGIKCVYETANNVVGTVTGGSPATLHLEEALPFDLAASSALCRGGAVEAEWDGNYVTTSALFVANS